LTYSNTMNGGPLPETEMKRQTFRKPAHPEVARKHGSAGAACGGDGVRAVPEAVVFPAGQAAVASPGGRVGGARRI